jgi:hypothetical protein
MVGRAVTPKDVHILTPGTQGTLQMPLSEGF